MKCLINRMVLVGVAIVLSGCVSPSTILRTEGPTMKELYEGGHDTRNRDSMSYSAQRSMAFQGSIYPQYTAYTRDAANEVEQLFPRHENPTITIFVYPHLAKNRLPIPAYTTATQLYNGVEYALPNETNERLTYDPYHVNSQQKNHVGKPVVSSGNKVVRSEH